LNSGSWVVDLDALAEASPAKKGKKPWKAPLVKTLATEDLDKYTIFDVIMPLPGRDVDYPGGALGERYQELIRTDGLDPSNWTRPQKFVRALYARCPF
jgi:tRNA pseudouridine13 synthase